MPDMLGIQQSWFACSCSIRKAVKAGTIEPLLNIAGSLRACSSSDNTTPVNLTYLRTAATTNLRDISTTYLTFIISLLLL
jgi:hypothetical protein